MQKYLIVISVLLILAIYVAVQDQTSPTTSAQQSPPPTDTAITVESHDNHSAQNAENARRNPPRWYRLFRWPEGITTWAIILTLLAVAEQARESAKATQAVRDSIPLQKATADAALLNANAVIASERPWVRVRVEEKTVDKDRESKKSLRSFQLFLYNYGKTPAHVTNCAGPKIEFCESPEDELEPLPNYPTDQRWEKQFLAPADGFKIGETIYPSDVMLERILSNPKGDKIKGNLVAYGLIEYTDGISERPYKTAFCYRHERGPASSMGGHFVLAGPKIYNEYT